jgi:hypothetical protein
MVKDVNVVEVVRPLDGADIALLAEADKGVKPFLIKKLRDSHHLLARCVAMGWSLREIAEKTGYSYSRVSILKSDPTFAELVDVYRTKLEDIRDMAARDYFLQLSALHGDVIEEIHDRLLDAPELISTGTALDIAKFTSDRVGLGPTHKSQNVNVNLDLAGRVAAGRQRALQLSAGADIDSASKAPEGPCLPLPGPVAPSQPKEGYDDES